jgi:hypothetical protein
MTRRKMSTVALVLPQALLGEIRALIESARQRVTAMVNSELTLLFWRIGRRIHTEVLAGERAGYGEQIVPALAAQLTRDYGQSFAEKNLRRMVQFAVTFPDERIVVTLSRQLSWSHFVALVPLKDALQREYYAQMCSTERWSVRTLRGRIRFNAIRAHGTISAAGRIDRTGAGDDAERAVHVTQSRHARPLRP